MAVRVQTAPFDAGEELNALHAAQLGIGAVVGFVGYVRDYNEGQDVAGSETRRVVRCSRRAPRCASRLATRRVTTAGDRSSARAAAAKLPSSTTRWNRAA